MKNPSNSDDPYEQAVTRLRDTIERNIDRGTDTAAQLDKTLVSLSAGALLLSITFVPTFTPKKLWLGFLLLAWFSFAVAMILVIFAMRSQQAEIENTIKQASEDLKKLEENPTIARQFIKELKIEKPLVHKQVTQHSPIWWLNFCALMAFIVGVVSLATFTGYNLWRTPPAEQHATPLRSAPAQR